GAGGFFSSGQGGGGGSRPRQRVAEGHGRCRARFQVRPLPAGKMPPRDDSGPTKKASSGCSDAPSKTASSGKPPGPAPVKIARNRMWFFVYRPVLTLTPPVNDTG